MTTPRARRAPPRPSRAPTRAPTGAPTGLARWLGDVVVLHARARRGLRVEVVHDLRVAIRRCRALAQGLREIDDDDGARRWKALADAGRPLFQGLGDLRDAQVMRGHAESVLAEDASRDVVLAALDRRIAACKQSARAAVAAFDVEAWRAAALGLPERADALLGRRPLFDHLALRRYFEAREMHQAAMRSRGATALHTLRIGVKKLRYTVENFLPDAHARIGKPLKKMQEVLGDLHDFDVLIAFLASEHVHLHSADRSRAASVVRAARDDRVVAYRALVAPSAPDAGDDAHREGAWQRVRAALAQGDDVDRAHDALIAQRAAGHGDPREPGAARALLRASATLLRACERRVRAFADPRARRLVHRASLCALAGSGKRARKLVDALPLAVGFTARDRALLAVVARAALGRAPAPDDERVAALPARDQPLALAAGALVHLAWALVPAAPFVVRAGADVVVIDAARPLALDGALDAERSFILRRAALEAILGVPLWAKAPPQLSSSGRPSRSRTRGAPRGAPRAPAGARPSA